MATQMQPSLNGILNAANHVIPEKRDRNAAPPSSSPDHRFDTIFGSAQGRRTGLGHEAMPVRARQAANVKAEGHSSTDSQTERTTKGSATTRREETSTAATQSGNRQGGGRNLGCRRRHFCCSFDGICRFCRGGRCWPGNLFGRNRVGSQAGGKEHVR